MASDSYNSIGEVGIAGPPETDVDGEALVPPGLRGERRSRRYERIGTTYAATRREEPRLASALRECVGAARSLVNVGAGTGNYETMFGSVVAAEPSTQMLRQRPSMAAPAAQCVAEALPFPNNCFEASLAVFTLHHWSDPAAGLLELRRVSDRQVIMFFEPSQAHKFWCKSYFPESLSLVSESNAPGIAVIAAGLQVREVRPWLVPADCSDGMGTAFWARPEQYLRPEVQAGMSWLALLSDDARRRGTERLRADLDSGVWDRQFGHLRDLEAYDAGYRIAVAGPG